jgi:hypothetical protein
LVKVYIASDGFFPDLVGFIKINYRVAFS